MNMDKYVLNHYYMLRHDLKRTYIVAPDDSMPLNSIAVNSGWISKIHPIYAMILSFFSKPVSLKKAISEISEFLSLEETYIKNFLNQMIDAKEPQYTEYANHINGFPINILIKEEHAFCKPQQYLPQDFIYQEIDLESERPYKVPHSLVYMINNTCATKCIYCYADTKTKASSLPIKQLKELISKIKAYRIAEFKITGGEFFLYKEWEELMKVLNEHNYKLDLISTKVPLKEADIVKFKKFNTGLQISLDSLNPEIASKILRVKKNYIEQIIKMIDLLEKYKVSFQIATVITSYNESIDNLVQIYEFVKKLQYLRRWEIRIAFKSLYSNNDFASIKIKKDKINEIEKWIQEIKASSNLNILWSPDLDGRYKQTDKGSRYFTGARCSANMSNLVILPDGKVTICEQLYWNEKFIIGDITKQSIEEIWNSDKALTLHRLSRSAISAQSPCKKCRDFDDCFTYANRCFADIIKAYGWDKWDYPDPRCNKAPAFIYDIDHN